MKFKTHLPQIIAAIAIFILLNQSLLFAENKAINKAIPKGNESQIADVVDLSAVGGIEKAYKIAISHNKVDAYYKLLDSDGKLHIEFALRDDCQNYQSLNFCITFNWQAIAANKELEAKIVAQIKRADQKKLWQITSKKGTPNRLQENNSILSPFVNLPNQKALTFSKLVFSKIFLMLATIFSYLLILILPLVLLYKQKNLTKNEQAQNFVFWFVISLAVRLIVTEPTQINHYSSLLHQNWIENFPFHGLTFPLFAKFCLSIFHDSDQAIIRMLSIWASLVAPLCYLILTSKGFGKIHSNLSALLLVLLPFFVRLSTSDSEHGLLLSFYLLGLFCWIKALEKRSLMFFVICAASIILVLQSRPEAIFFPFTYLLFSKNLKHIPGRWFISLLPLGLVFVFTLQLSFETGGFGNITEEVQGQGQIEFVNHANMLLLKPMGAGIYHNEAQYSQYLADATLGVLPDIYFGEQSFRPQYMIQWIPAILTPFFWLGLLLALFTPRLWPILLTILLVRLPTILVPSGSFESNFEFLSARYFVPALLFQVVLSAYSISFLYKQASRFKITKMLANILGVLLLFVLLISSVRAYNFKYSFQHEYKFVKDNLPSLVNDATVFLVNSEFGMANEFEFDLIPKMSLFTAFRPDVAYENISERDSEVLLLSIAEEKAYFLELPLCKLQIDSLYLRDSFSPRWQTPPSQYSIIKYNKNNPGFEAGMEQMEKAKVLLREFKKHCVDVHQKYKLEKVSSKNIPIQDFLSVYFMHPGQVEISLYKITGFK